MLYIRERKGGMKRGMFGAFGDGALWTGDGIQVTRITVMVYEGMEGFVKGFCS